MSKLWHKLGLIYSKCAYVDRDRTIIICRNDKLVHLYNAETSKRMFEGYSIVRVRVGNSKEVGPIVYIQTSDNEVVYCTLRQGIERNISKEAKERGLVIVSELNQYLSFIAETKYKKYVAVDEYLTPYTNPVWSSDLLKHGYGGNIVRYDVRMGEIKYSEIINKNGEIVGSLPGKVSFASVFKNTDVYISENDIYDAETLDKIGGIKGRYKLRYKSGLLIAIAKGSESEEITGKKVLVYGTADKAFKKLTKFFDLAKEINIGGTVITVGVKEDRVWKIDEVTVVKYIGTKSEVERDYGVQI